VGGKKVWQTTSTKLADYDLRHRTQQSVEEDAEKFLKRLNAVAAPGVKGIRTFGEQSEIWLERIQTRQRKPIKPATLKNWKSHLNVHILSVFRNVPLPDVTNKKVKDFVADLSTRIGPKSIRNIVQVIKMVKASAIDDEGNELYPTKWNHDFIDMPVVKDREQRRPSFSAEQIEAMVKAGDRTMQMATILFAATGLRAGELLGLEIRHFDGTAVKVEQEAWGGIIQAPKTENAYRTIELDPAVLKLMNAFIGSRTTGYIFTNGGGKPIHQSNFLRRKFHPTLEAAGVPKAGFHGFRRYRNTYLRNVAGCPDGLLKFWLGHSASRDMSDRYDKIRDDAKFRRDQAEKMGVGFELPTELKEEKPQRQNKIPQICGTPCCTACAVRVT
jgi:integrase